MIEDADLKECLRVLAEAGPQDAGPGVQHELLVRFRGRRARRRSAYLAGTVVSLMAAVILSLALLHGRSTPQSATLASTEQTSGFFTLPYGQSGVPLEQPVIVRIDIPVSQLGAMGVQVNPQGANGMVRADLLVGQDGIARAVRFVE